MGVGVGTGVRVAVGLGVGVGTGVGTGPGPGAGTVNKPRCNRMTCVNPVFPTWNPASLILMPHEPDATLPINALFIE